MPTYTGEGPAAHDVTVPTAPAEPVAGEPRPSADRFTGASLRAQTAKGMIINGVFTVGVDALGLAKGVIVVSFLTASQYGLWGLVALTVGTMLWLLSIGLDDKYIQQDHPDGQVAFEIAFTLQCILCAGFAVLMVVGVPLFALLYGHASMVAPTLALTLAAPAIALQTPLWVYYRRMDFGRQRLLQAVDPLVSFVVTIALIAAGLGIWGLVIGALCGSWSAALVVLRHAPYKLRFRYESGALREYARFSWPLFVGSGSAMIAMQVPVVVASHRDLATVGAITLAGTISQFANRVDDMLTQSLYPAICAVKDHLELLFESFWKSNRLALLWATPCGIGAVLFTPAFVHYVIGDKWQFAVVLVQIFGATAAFNQIGFNWSAFFRARNETRPLAVAGTAWLAVVLALAVPLLITDGIDAFGVGMAIATVVTVAVRVVYLTRLFPALAIAGHVARGLWPSLPPLVAVLLIRSVAGESGVGLVLLEVVVFAGVTVATTVASERRLLAESLRYVLAGGVAKVA